MRNRRLLPDWLSTFEKTFDNTEAPEKYVYWIAVGTIGAALQRNVVFDEITFQLYPNHYIVLVGPPAVKKTTAINFGINLLRLIEGINVGPSAVTWQYLVDILVKIQTASPEESARTGVLVKDSCPIVLPASEIGTLFDFEDRNAINFFTEAWDSPKVFDKGTRMMGDQMLNGPTPSVMAGATPQWIKDNIKGTTRSGGFISRCIMPYANRPRRVIAYPSQHVSVDHSENLSKLAHDLGVIATLRGNYRLTPDAMKFGTQWHGDTSQINYGIKIADDSDNWANRRYTHVHKLALVLAASRRDELIITKEDLEEAVKKIAEVHADFNNVFALLDQRKETKGTREIEEYLRSKKKIPYSQLVLDMRIKFTSREINDALNILVASNIAKRESGNIRTRDGGLGSADFIIFTGSAA